MREYYVVVGNRVYQTFMDKEKAVEQARTCYECGLDNVWIAHKNWNPVKGTPVFSREIDKMLNSGELRKKDNGEMEYILKHNGKTFVVTYGENKIFEYRASAKREIVVDFWNRPPQFQTFMQAVMWLKDKVNEL